MSVFGSCLNHWKPTAVAVTLVVFDSIQLASGRYRPGSGTLWHLCNDTYPWCFPFVSVWVSLASDDTLALFFNSLAALSLATSEDDILDFVGVD